MKATSGTATSTIRIFCDTKVDGSITSSSGNYTQKFRDVDPSEDLRGQWLINLATVESHKVIDQDNNTVTITTREGSRKAPIQAAVESLKVVTWDVTQNS